MASQCFPVPNKKTNHQFAWQSILLLSNQLHLVTQQANKSDREQQSLASVLQPANPTHVYDVAIVGAGPAGMCLAGELGKRGVSTVIVGK